MVAGVLVSPIMPNTIPSRYSSDIGENWLHEIMRLVPITITSLRINEFLSSGSRYPGVLRSPSNDDSEGLIPQEIHFSGVILIVTSSLAVKDGPTH